MHSLNAVNLQKFIDEQGITAHILHLDVDTPTVADAAVSLNVAPKQIIKSVLFVADGQPVGIVIYHIEGAACEILLLHSAAEGQGVGSAGAALGGSTRRGDIIHGANRATLGSSVKNRRCGACAETG